MSAPSTLCICVLCVAQGIRYRCPYTWLHAFMCPHVHACPCTCALTPPSACLHDRLHLSLYTCPYTCLCMRLIQQPYTHMPAHTMGMSAYVSVHVSTVCGSSHMSVHTCVHNTDPCLVCLHPWPLCTCAPICPIDTQSRTCLCTRSMSMHRPTHSSSPMFVRALCIYACVQVCV